MIGENAIEGFWSAEKKYSPLAVVGPCCIKKVIKVTYQQQALLLQNVVYFIPSKSMAQTIPPSI
jgi:hypothetical protein